MKCKQCEQDETRFSDGEHLTITRKNGDGTSKEVIFCNENCLAVFVMEAILQCDWSAFDLEI